MAKKKSIGDRLTYAYIRKIKKWMFCPACQKGKMTIDKKSTVWTCEDCGYSLLADDFEDDYVFWFCDECNTYLNNQDGFDRQASRHICKNCGYENDITLDNVKGICSDCGKIIPDANATLCADCLIKRRQKAKEWWIKAGKVVGAVAVVVGAAYLAAQAGNNDSENDINTDENDNDNNNNQSNSRYKLIFDGEEQDEVFSSEEEAEEHALYLCSCTRTGAEILHMSNPGDYDYDEDSFEDPEYEIIEED